MIRKLKAFWTAFIVATGRAIVRGFAGKSYDWPTEAKRIYKRELACDPVNVRQFLVEQMKRAGYTGLCNSEAECGCSLDEPTPCEYPNFEDCFMAYRRECPCPAEPECHLRADGADYCFHIEKGGMANNEHRLRSVFDLGDRVGRERE